MVATSAVFNIRGMHCGSCSLLIDETVEELAGVSRALTELRSARSTVWFDPIQVSSEQIIAAIAGLGYVATTQDGPQR